MTTEQRYRAILANHLPEPAVDWVFAYLQRHSVHFTVAQPRSSKLGDYRRPHGDHPFHEITVNGDLQKPMFAWVFLHEAAHLEAHLKHKNIQPHGHEWQTEYAHLLADHLDWFPDDLRPDIAAYVARIPLNRVRGQHIETRLNAHPGQGPVLDQMPPGTRFRLSSHPGRTFVSEQKRRTRWICLDTADHRRYLVSGQAHICPEP